MSVSWGEVLVVLFLVLLLFGGKRLPELARSMGQAVNEFKRGLNTEAVDNKPVDANASGGKNKDETS